MKKQNKSDISDDQKATIKFLISVKEESKPETPTKEIKDYNWRMALMQNEKETKEAYLIFLKDNKLTDKEFREMIGDESVELIKDYFHDFYFKPLIASGDGTISSPFKVGEEKDIKTREQNEELMWILLNKVEFVEKRVKFYTSKHWNFNIKKGEKFEEFLKDAETECQIVLIKYRGNYNPNKSGNGILGYYDRVVKNKIIELLMKEKDNLPLLTESKDEKQDFLEFLSNKSLLNIVNKNLKNLTKKQSDAIQLVYFEGLGQEEAAKKLTISQSSLNETLKRGIDRLKKLLS